MAINIPRLAFATVLIAGCTAATQPRTRAVKTESPAPVGNLPAPEDAQEPPVTRDVGGKRATQGGSIVTSPDDTLVIAFDEDNGTAVAIDARSGKRLSSRHVGQRPVAGIALAGGGVAVVDRAEGTVALYALDSAGLGEAPIATQRVADDPVAIAASPDHGTLYVTSGATSTLTVLAADTLAPKFTVPVAREPRAIAPSRDGKKLYIGQLVGGIVSVVTLADRRVHTLRLPLAPERQTLERVNAKTAPRLRNIAALARSLVIDPHRDELYVAHVVEANGSELAREARASGYGGIDQAEIDALRPVATVSVLDTRREQWIAPAHNPPDARPPVFTDPSAITVRGPDGGFVLVSRATRSLGVFERAGSDPLLQAKTVRLDKCDGASGVAIDAKGSAWINCQFDHRVVAVKRDGTVSSGVSLGDDPLPPDVSLGRRAFFRADDDAISRLGFSCATCHPDGRDDGNVWLSENGMRQTISLAGRIVGTAPYGWNGHNPTLDLSLQQTVIRLSGLGLQRPAREALAAYVARGLEPAHVVKERDALVAAGEAVFGRAGCTSCHDPRRQFTDGEAHDVHSAAAGDADARFDTPSLVGVGATAPYFHDGRYATLESLLFDNRDRMGHTSDLSQNDMRALIAYLNAL